MNRNHTLKTSIATAMLALVGAASVAAAAPAAAPMPPTVSDRGAAKDHESQREVLQASLSGLTTAAAVRDKLAAQGWMITAVNEAERNHAEYEVVKGRHSFEVQLDIAKDSGKLKDIDVTPNLWRAESTERAMEGKPYETVKSTDFGDRRYLQAWNDEKDRLENALAKGMTAPETMSKLKSLGYTVTAVNDKERDYVEYEIVKGRHSYEVQVDLDKRTGKSTDIDVAANLWKADSTEAALARNGR